MENLCTPESGDVAHLSGMLYPYQSLKPTHICQVHVVHTGYYVYTPPILITFPPGLVANRKHGQMRSLDCGCEEYCFEDTVPEHCLMPCPSDRSSPSTTRFKENHGTCTNIDSVIGAHVQLYVSQCWLRQRYTILVVVKYESIQVIDVCWWSI